MRSKLNLTISFPPRQQISLAPRPRQCFRHYCILPMLALLVFSAGCSCNRTTVVLLPDHDNHVGKVEITNPHGTTQIDQAGYGVTLRQQFTPPPATPIEEKEIKSSKIKIGLTNNFIIKTLMFLQLRN